jgi:hypothetical protein
MANFKRFLRHLSVPSVEDAAQIRSTPKCRQECRHGRLKPTLRRAARRVFIGIGGPQGHGDSLLRPVSFPAAPYPAGTGSAAIRHTMLANSRRRKLPRL